MTGQPDIPGTSPDAEQPFVSHLLELRDRLLRVVISVLLVFLALAWFAQDLYTLLAEPLLSHLPQGSSMIAIDPVTPFFTPFKLTLILSFFIAIPYVLYQAWAFVAPGLYQHERKLVLPLLVSSTALYYTGMAFAYFIVLPLVFKFITATSPEGVAVMTDISRYLDFVLTIFFAFGVAFEVPVATILLVWAGVTTPESLKEKRSYVIVGCFVIAAILTPPDVISQFLLAVPMWLLFEAGVWLAQFYVRKDEDTSDKQDGQMVPQGADAEPRYRPMTQEEMEAELEAIERMEEAERRKEQERKAAGDTKTDGE